MEPRRFSLIASFIASAALAFGQLDSNSITINASRAIDLQPDQVIFTIIVQSSPNTSFDAILGALQGSGITAANLTGGYPPPIVIVANPFFQPAAGWIFTLTVPLDQIKTTVASLTMIQQTNAQKNNGLGLTFAVQNAQVSQRLQQPDQCPTADLVTDAQNQARKLADAAGLAAGPIVALSDGPMPAVAGNFAFATVPSNVIPTAIFRIGDFSSTTTSVTTTPRLSVPSPSLYCTITVKFQLLRYQ